ncbi:MAG: SPOR domain-containing protein [Gammaproteobacteria bacterium]
MPPPSSENDLKRRARRRLIGAVALTLLAVIVLPLLLEDEPPPGSPLAVRMTPLPPAAETTPEPVPIPDHTPPSRVEPSPASAPRAAQMEIPRAAPGGAPATPVPPPKPEPVKPVPPKPAPIAVAPPRPKPPPPPAAVEPVPKPPVGNERYVVQVAALSDAGKVRALEVQIRGAGLPVYTDRLGTLTRVRVGPFSTRPDAEAAVRRLHAQGMKEAQVLAP